MGSKELLQVRPLGVSGHVGLCCLSFPISGSGARPGPQGNCSGVVVVIEGPHHSVWYLLRIAH